MYRKALSEGGTGGGEGGEVGKRREWLPRRSAAGAGGCRAEIRPPRNIRPYGPPRALSRAPRSVPSSALPWQGLSGTKWKSSDPCLTLVKRGSSLRLWASWSLSAAAVVPEGGVLAVERRPVHQDRGAGVEPAVVVGLEAGLRVLPHVQRRAGDTSGVEDVVADRRALRLVEDEAVRAGAVEGVVQEPGVLHLLRHEAVLGAGTGRKSLSTVTSSVR